MIICCRPFSNYIIVLQVPFHADFSVVSWVDLQLFYFRKSHSRGLYARCQQCQQIVKHPVSMTFISVLPSPTYFNFKAPQTSPARNFSSSHIASASAFSFRTLVSRHAPATKGAVDLHPTAANPDDLCLFSSASII